MSQNSQTQTADNIKAVVKIRPRLPREKQKQSLWKTQENHIYNTDDPSLLYSFDHVFDESKNNTYLYETSVKPLVLASLNGINSTIFAYGQTSTGKTHAMLGNTSDPGIMLQALDDIFKHIEQDKDRKYLITCSYLEIYNEKINDLLNKNGKDLKLRETIEGRPRAEVKEEVINEPSQAMALMRLGCKIRKISCTDMNERSSRSHTIFRINIHSQSKEDGEAGTTDSQLNLVDLAGSERIGQTKATGNVKKEGVHINLSLVHLGIIIRKLSENSSYVSYRDSKLTRLLQSALGGNSNTLVIATITLFAAEETKGTLEFGQTARTIKNRPTVNFTKDLREHNEILKQLTIAYKQKLEHLQSERDNVELLHKEYRDKLAALNTFVITNDRIKESCAMENARRRHTIHFSSGKSLQFFKSPKKISGYELYAIQERDDTSERDDETSNAVLSHETIINETSSDIELEPDDIETADCGTQTSFHEDEMFMQFSRKMGNELDDEFPIVMVETPEPAFELNRSSIDHEELAHPDASTPEPNSELSLLGVTPTPTLRKKLEDLERSYESLKNFTKLEKEMTTSEMGIFEEFKEQMDRLRRDYIANNLLLEKSQNQVASLLQDLKFAQDQITELQTYNNSLETRKNELQVEIEYITNDYTFELSRKEKIHTDKISFYENEIEKLRSAETVGYKKTSILEVTEKDNKIKRLEQLITELDEKNFELIQDLDTERRKNKNLIDKFSTYETDRDTILREKVGAENEIAQILEDTVHSIPLVSLQKKEEKLKKRCDELKTKLKLVNTKCSRLKQINAEQKKKSLNSNRFLGKQIRRLKKLHKSSVNSWTKNERELRTKYEQTLQAKEKLEGLLEEAQNLVEENKNRECEISEYHKEIDNLKKQVALHAKEKQTILLENQVTYSKLSIEVESLKNTINADESKIALLTTKKLKLENIVSELEEGHIRLVLEKDSLEKKIDELKEKLNFYDEHKRGVGELNRKIRYLESEKQKLKETLDKLSDEKNVKMTQEKIIFMENKIKVLNTQISSISDNYKELRKSFVDLNEAHKEEMATFASTLLEKFTTEKSELQNQITNLNETISLMQIKGKENEKDNVQIHWEEQFSQERTKFENEIENLNLKISQLTKEKLELSKMINDLKDEHYTSLEIEKENNKKAIKKSQREIQSLLLELSELKLMKIDIEESVRNLIETNKEIMETEKEKMRLCLAKYEEKFSTEQNLLAQENETLKKQVYRQIMDRREMDDYILDLTEQFHEATAREKENMDRCLSNLRDKCNEEQAILKETMENILSELATENLNLKSEKEEAIVKCISEFDIERSNFKENIANLEEKISTLTADKEKLEETVANLEETYKHEMINAKKQSESQINELKQKFDCDKANLQIELDTASSKVSMLTADNEKLEDIIKSMQDMYNDILDQQSGGESQPKYSSPLMPQTFEGHVSQRLAFAEAIFDELRYTIAHLQKVLVDEKDTNEGRILQNHIIKTTRSMKHIRAKLKELSEQLSYVNQDNFRLIAKAKAKHNKENIDNQPRVSTSKTPRISNEFRPKESPREATRRKRHSVHDSNRPSLEQMSVADTDSDEQQKTDAQKLKAMYDEIKTNFEALKAKYETLKQESETELNDLCNTILERDNEIRILMNRNNALIDEKTENTSGLQQLKEDAAKFKSLYEETKKNLETLQEKYNTLKKDSEAELDELCNVIYDKDRGIQMLIDENNRLMEEKRPFKKPTESEALKMVRIYELERVVENYKKEKDSLLKEVQALRKFGHTTVDVQTQTEMLQENKNVQVTLPDESSLRLKCDQYKTLFLSKRKEVKILKAKLGIPEDQPVVPE